MNRRTEMSDAGDERRSAPYWTRSRKPLAILLFLLPFVLFYELTLVFLPDQEVRFQLVAYEGIERIFEVLLQIFGAVADRETVMAIPGILLVVCLLVWHVMERDRWRIEGPTLPLMWMESALVAIPVVVLGLLLPSTPAAASLLQEGAGAATIEGRDSLLSLLSMAVGAGLYEELIFRWVLIALTHALLADLLGMPNRIAIAVAVVLSSLLFMLAHQPDSFGPVVFYLLAGGWFSALYLVRGFGIAAGGHIAYDVAWVALSSIHASG